jgi:hypothetical protein
LAAAQAGSDLRIDAHDIRNTPNMLEYQRMRGTGTELADHSRRPGKEPLFHQAA